MRREYGIGIKISVPTDYYEIVLKRFSELYTKKREGWDRLNRFLAHRCGGAFLTAFLTRHPEFISNLHAKPL